METEPGQPNRPSILAVIEDQASVNQMAQRLEAEGYIVIGADDPASALELLSRRRVELIVLDSAMPDEKVRDICKRVRSGSSGERPSVLLMIDPSDPERFSSARALMADDVIGKPMNGDELAIRVSSMIHGSGRITARERIEAAEEEIGRLQASQEEVIFRLASAAEYDLDHTGRHLKRMSEYCHLMAKKMGLPEDRCDLIRDAAPLHDVGNISIPDHILLKAARHAPQEYEIMKRHAAIGHNILKGAESELLKVADLMAWTHHERFDGTGYPRGICGEDIPREGRICAVADVFDALTTRRVYRAAYPLEKSINIMQDERGRHFDPETLDMFLESMDEVIQIKNRYDLI